MRTLRYSINVTLDGCVDHRAPVSIEDAHRIGTENVARADALLFGRRTYELMADAWRPPLSPEIPEWMHPFAAAIDATPKYVVTRGDDVLGWNGRLVHGDLAGIVAGLPDGEILVGGVELATAVAALGLIDEYEFVVHPVVAGHGPHLLGGLTGPLDLLPTGREELPSGVVVARFAPRR